MGKKKVIPASQTRLNEVAMLVAMQIHGWNAVKVDKKAGAEVAKLLGSDPTMGQYQKRLLDPKAPELLAIVSLTNALRQAHNFRTLPWIDGGTRILSSKGYFEYTRLVGDLVQQYDAAAVAFVNAYDAAVKTAKKRLGSLFVGAEYPTLQELKGRFSVDVRFFPIPAQEDFRVDLGTEETERIRASIQEAAQLQVQAAMRDVWQRLHDLLVKASAKLKAYKRTKDGGVEHGFKDSLISNITDLLAMVPALNITDDPTLTEFVERIRAEVTMSSPEELRDDQKLRSMVAAQADDILSKMAGYLS